MTFVLLDERQDSINDGYFVTEMDSFPNAATTKIVDYPASYHNKVRVLHSQTVIERTQPE